MVRKAMICGYLSRNSLVSIADMVDPVQSWYRAWQTLPMLEQSSWPMPLEALVAAAMFLLRSVEVSQLVKTTKSRSSNESLQERGPKSLHKHQENLPFSAP